MKLLADYDVDLQYHPGKLNVVPDALSRVPGEYEALQLTQQKELLREMMRLDLMVVRRISGVSEKLMAFQVQPILKNRIREAQSSDSRLQQFRVQVEAGQRTDFWVHIDGALYSGDMICVPKGDIRREILAEAYSSAYSIHPGSTKMYRDLKQHFW